MDPLLFTPGPTNVPSRVLKAMAKPMITHRGATFRSLYSSVEDKIKQLLDTENEVFLLTASGTGGVEAAVANLVKKGTKVIVPIFGTFSERIANAVKTYGGEVITRKYKEGTGPVKEDIAALIDEHSNAEILFIVYNDTSPGVMLKDIDQICKIAKDNGLITVVDGISIVGGAPVHVDTWNIDVFIGATQKCLGTPPGLSFISVSREVLEKSKNINTIYFSFELFKKFAEKRETPFTPAIPLFYALDEALNIILSEIGYKRWLELHERRAEALYKSLEVMNFIPFVHENFRSVVVISTSGHPSLECPALKSELEKKYAINISGGLGELKNKIIRVGNMGFLTWRDVLTLIAAIAEVLLEHGIEEDVSKALSIIGNYAAKTPIPWDG